MMWLLVRGAFCRFCRGKAWHAAQSTDSVNTACGDICRFVREGTAPGCVCIRFSRENVNRMHVLAHFKGTRAAPLDDARYP